MAAIVQMSRPPSSNRRSRVRHKVHVPAYATFSAGSRSDMLELYEVLDMSESGVALHCSLPMQVDQTVEMNLDLAESEGQISATARVVWSDSAGRVGFGLPALAGSSGRRLREWLLLNALAAAADAEDSAGTGDLANSPRQNYTDVLSAASAVQKEAESLGPDLEAVLTLVVSRSRSLLRASGAAIAIEGKDAGTMICRASAGPSAPPVGIILQAGSGFSGECVRTGRLLRCDDTESDDRVDRQSCRALGIRSMLAAPILMGEKVIGLLAVFSTQPKAFGENDSVVLQRFSETILAAVNRAIRSHDLSAPPQASPKPFSPSPGSILFAHLPEENADKDKDENKNKNKEESDGKDHVGGIRLPRAHLFLLIAVAATIFMALGFISAPWIQPWIQQKLQGRGQSGEHTVFASSKPSTEAANSAALALSVDSANPAQLRELAGHGDAAAENALGLLYSAGDEKQGIKRDESDAARWFIKAAEHGSVPAQSKLGSLYWAGRGLPQSSDRAYFWTVLARAGGDDASKVLAPFIAGHLTPAQRSAIEQEAEQWIQRRQPATKSVAAR